jgi:transcriptional regulator with XRE-family HTH domain
MMPIDRGRDRTRRRRGRENGTKVPYLRAWRRKAFLSQGELAKLVGKSDALISYVENGYPTSIQSIRLIAEALHITPDQLLTQDPGDIGQPNQ